MRHTYSKESEACQSKEGSCPQPGLKGPPVLKQSSAPTMSDPLEAWLGKAKSSGVPSPIPRCSLFDSFGKTLLCLSHSIKELEKALGSSESPDVDTCPFAEIPSENRLRDLRQGLCVGKGTGGRKTAAIGSRSSLSLCDKRNPRSNASFWPGDVDANLSSFDFFPVEGVDGFLGFFLIGHLDKPKPP